MRPVLGFQLELVSRGTLPVDDGPWLRGKLEEWVRGWYERRGTPLPLDGLFAGSVPTPPAHTLSIDEYQTAGGVLVDVTWQYPADGDRSALWTSRATIAADPTGADLTLSLSIASAEFVARPFHFDLFVPRLIRDIARSDRAVLAGRSVTTLPRSVSVGAVGGFVDADLRSPTRRLPIVVVARVAATEQFAVDPAKLAVELCGLAEVWVLNDRWTAYALSDAIGPRLSCFDGGIRTYWPGFNPGDEPFSHPLITQRRLLTLEHDDIDIARHLVRHLAPVGAIRLAETRRARHLRHLVAEERRAEARATLKRSMAAGRVDDLEQQLLAAWYERDQMATERDRESARAVEAEKELTAVRQNFAIVAAAGRTEVGAEQQPLTRGPEISSVSAALDVACSNYQTLRPWASATKSAGASRFARPELVYHALEAIAEIGRLYQEQRETKASVGSLEARFEERGFKYAPSDSQTTLTKYGGDRTFTNGSHRRLFERHLTLGGGDRQNCLQVYFDFDTTEDRVDIAYCGMHLPYDGMRS